MLCSIRFLPRLMEDPGSFPDDRNGRRDIGGRRSGEPAINSVTAAARQAIGPELVVTESIVTKIYDRFDLEVVAAQPAIGGGPAGASTQYCLLVDGKKVDCETSVSADTTFTEPRRIANAVVRVRPHLPELGGSPCLGSRSASSVLMRFGSGLCLQGGGPDVPVHR